MLRILVVDDSATMRYLIVKALKQIGYDDCHIIQCDTGNKVLEFIEKAQIDLVLLDWYIPEMDGLKVLKAIKRGKFKNTPVIMLTTEQNKKKITAAIAAGADEYILKPLQTTILYSKLTKIAKKYKLDLLW